MLSNRLFPSGNDVLHRSHIRVSKLVFDSIKEFRQRVRSQDHVDLRLVRSICEYQNQLLDRPTNRGEPFLEVVDEVL